MKQPVRGALVVAVLLVLTACKLTPAVPIDVAYNRATGWGQYLDPAPGRALAMTPTATDVSYAAAGTTNADMKFDLYVPTTPVSNGPRPLVIWFHGLGGTKASAEIAPAVRELFARGFVVVSANYTMNAAARGLPASTMLTQGKRLVRLLKVAAAVNGAASPWNANRIYVAGISGGGYLASMIGLTPGQFEPTDTAVASQTSAVAGVIGFQAPFDLTQMVNWASTNIATPGVNLEVGIIESAVNTWFGCRLPARTTGITLLLPKCDAPTQAALLQGLSPSSRVAASNPNTPFFLVTGSRDLVVQSVAQGKAFSDALTARNTAANVGDGSAWTDLVGANHGANLAIPIYNDRLPNAGQFVPNSPLSSISMVHFLGFVGCLPNATSTAMNCLP